MKHGYGTFAKVPVFGKAGVRVRRGTPGYIPFNFYFSLGNWVQQRYGSGAAWVRS